MAPAIIRGSKCEMGSWGVPIYKVFKKGVVKTIRSVLEGEKRNEESFVISRHDFACSC